MQARGEGFTGMAKGRWARPLVVACALAGAAHGHTSGAAASAGLRLALPLVGGGVSFAAGEATCGTECGVRIGLYGAGLGMSAAAIIDIALLSKEQPAEEPLVVPLAVGSF